MTLTKRLICCCCGESAIGRQWWNRDKGYGLCAACVHTLCPKMSPEEFHQFYGQRGLHVATHLTAFDEPGALVYWKTLDGGTVTGTLKEIDNGTAIVATEDGLRSTPIA